MVARNLVVRHHDEQFDIECDTDLGFEVLQYQIFSLTSVPPEDQRILLDDGGLVVSDGFDLESLSENLRLLSVQEEEKEKARAVEIEKSDEELARMLQAEEEALMLQQYAAGSNGREFEQRVRSYLSQVLMYEDPVRQDAARKTVPVDEIEEKALVALAKEGILKPSKDKSDHAFLLQLLLWFKESFRWVNSPPCDKCAGGTNGIGMGNPEHSEIEFGAHRVELYRCNICSSITRFPRYNDPMKLLETRKGRCGEWANCFTLYCRAFGYDARLIMDFTDHVWTECFSQSLGRWMHLDPCEGVYDNPLLYERGWNKKLNYVIAIAKDGTYDVTKRYTRSWHEVLLRRNLAAEDVIALVLSSIRKECRTRFSSEICHLLENRDNKESEELDRDVYLQADASISLPGRQSGAIAWRIERSECGSSENNSLSCSSCPIRKCVDDHVSRIYTAFALLYTQIIAENLPQAIFLEVLQMLQAFLVNLKNQPFKNRSSLLGPFGSLISKNSMLCIETFLSAISLKRELGYSDGNVCFSLSGDPVQTSLALPVALDLINEIMDTIKEKDVLSRDVQFPKVNRLTSGSVLASSEELPFGIATSAFDGTLSTKWEEPNGANGCWLIYEVANGQMYELQSYDFLSANDAPERDPMNWILEGSEDGGSTWSILDEQNSQIFDRRFQRRTFSVKKMANSNTFRFRFLFVRDAKATSRFQIGGINLYAKK